MYYFVMLNGGNDMPLPLVDEYDNTMLYATREEAEQAGEDNLLGQARGYEVYEWLFKD